MYWWIELDSGKDIIINVAQSIDMLRIPIDDIVVMTLNKAFASVEVDPTMVFHEVDDIRDTAREFWEQEFSYLANRIFQEEFQGEGDFKDREALYQTEEVVKGCAGREYLEPNLPY